MAYTTTSIICHLPENFFLALIGSKTKTKNELSFHSEEAPSTREVSSSDPGEMFTFFFPSEIMLSDNFIKEEEKNKNQGALEHSSLYTCCEMCCVNKGATCQ